jgi:serine/threonine-protein kinase RsbW
VSHALLVSSPPDDVDTVHDLLDDVWAGHGAVRLRDRMSFETAIIELASNVLRHADSGSGITCRLDIVVRPDRLEATLTDSGEPGDIQLAGRELPDELAESGRGIPLVQALVDVVEYDRGGELNRWYIARTLRS